MSVTRSVIVIGGGISGLTAAWWMRSAGMDVMVLEQDTRAGGTMRTTREDGWLIETGPNSTLETTPLLGRMFEDLGIAGKRLYADPSADKRYILRGGKLHCLPMGPGAFLTSGLWTAGGKLRLLKEPFIGRADHEESLAEFVERRLGREFLDYTINPFVAGVYAGNPEQLSVRAAFPKLYALEEKYGGLIRGMIGGARERKRRAEKAKDRARMFSFAKGMETFPASIAASLGNRFRGGAVVHALRAPASAGNRTLSDPGGTPNVPRAESRDETARKSEGARFSVTASLDGASVELTADAVVLAVPAYCAAPLVGPLLPDLAGMLEEVYYPPVAELFLGYRTDQVPAPLDGFGYLIPARESRQILGTIWSSSLFPNRAPDGHVALTSFVGGSRQPALVGCSDAELIALTHGDIASILGVRGTPVFSRVIRWPRAIPQYVLGYERLTSALDAAERSLPGLFFCANYRRGIAVGDCVMNGERIAARAASLLGAPYARPSGSSD